MLHSVSFSSFSSSFSSPSSVLERFAEFRARFRRRYASPAEFEHRLAVFQINEEFVAATNAQNLSWTLGMNAFSDMTADEFKKYASSSVGSKMGGCTKFISTGAKVPDSVNWVDRGAVTSVKDQGSCGSCWAFSATGAMEGARYVSGGALADLSEQELVDCVRLSAGCNGGSMDAAFRYIAANGQCLDRDYPYVSGTTQVESDCQQAKCEPSVVASGCVDVPSGDQVALKEAVAQQPVSVAIDAASPVFQFYKSGVITSDACGEELNHGVLAVGYGVTPEGQDYWLVKNSWSADWGDAGYVKIARGSGTGTCGIGAQASFPVV